MTQHDGPSHQETARQSARLGADQATVPRPPSRAVSGLLEHLAAVLEQGRRLDQKIATAQRLDESDLVQALERNRQSIEERIRMLRILITNTRRSEQADGTTARVD
jgi:hypothetical protein